MLETGPSVWVYVGTGLRREAGRMTESGKTVLAVLSCLLTFCLSHSPSLGHHQPAQSRKVRETEDTRRGPEVDSLGQEKITFDFVPREKNVRLLKGRKERERRERLERTGRVGYNEVQR